MYLDRDELHHCPACGTLVDGDVCGPACEQAMIDRRLEREVAEAQEEPDPEPEE